MVYSKYPDQIDSTNELPIAVDNQTFVRAESVNRLRDAIANIENELGAKPSRTYGTVKSRLDAIEAATGTISGDTTILSARLTDAEEAIDDLEAEVATLSGGLFIPETYGAIGNGIADDTVAWNACIAATSNGDVVVATSRAGYKITNEITVNKSIIIMGGGKIVQSGVLKGGFLVTTSNVTIKDLWIYNARGGLDWNPVGNSPARGVVLTTASGAKVIDCRIENWGESGVKLVSGLGIEIAGNTIIGIGAAGGLVGGSNNNIGVCADTSGALLAGLNIHDNDISQTAQGVFTGNDFIDLSIHNNRIHDIIGQLAIYADNASGLSITNNTCTATGGIKVQTASNATSNSEGIVVSNNIIDCLGGPAGDTIGIMITPGQVGLIYYHRDVSVCNNIIRNVAIDGIRIDQCEDYLIQGNIIENVGERGIRFGNSFGCTARNGVVRGNTIRSTNYSGIIGVLGNTVTGIVDLSSLTYPTNFHGPDKTIIIDGMTYAPVAGQPISAADLLVELTAAIAGFTFSMNSSGYLEITKHISGNIIVGAGTGNTLLGLTAGTYGSANKCIIEDNVIETPATSLAPPDHTYSNAFYLSAGHWSIRNNRVRTNNSSYQYTLDTYVTAVIDELIGNDFPTTKLHYIQCEVYYQNEPYGLTITPTVAMVNGANHDVAMPSNQVKVGGPTAAFSLGGIASVGEALPTNGKEVTVYILVSQVFTVLRLSAGSAVANRIQTNTGGDMEFTAPCYITFKYDGNSACWTLKDHSQEIWTKHGSSVSLANATDIYDLAASVGECKLGGTYIDFYISGALQAYWISNELRFNVPGLSWLETVASPIISQFSSDLGHGVAPNNFRIAAQSNTHADTPISGYVDMLSVIGLKPHTTTQLNSATLAQCKARAGAIAYNSDTYTPVFSDGVNWHTFAPPGIIAPETYGGIADGQIVVDGYTDVGDSTLLSATASWVAADVGKYIRVTGAGPAGIDLLTTIASINDLHSIEMTDPATLSVTGAMVVWGTDNGGVGGPFDQAITAAAAIGGTVQLGYGTYCIANRFYPSYQGFTLKGAEGGGTRIAQIYSCNNLGDGKGSFVWFPKDMIGLDVGLTATTLHADTVPGANTVQVHASVPAGSIIRIENAGVYVRSGHYVVQSVAGAGIPYTLTLDRPLLKKWLADDPVQVLSAIPTDIHIKNLTISGTGDRYLEAWGGLRCSFENIKIDTTWGVTGVGGLGVTFELGSRDCQIINCNGDIASGANSLFLVCSGEQCVIKDCDAAHCDLVAVGFYDCDGSNIINCHVRDSEIGVGIVGDSTNTGCAGCSVSGCDTHKNNIGLYVANGSRGTKFINCDSKYNIQRNIWLDGSGGAPINTVFQGITATYGVGNGIMIQGAEGTQLSDIDVSNNAVFSFYTDKPVDISGFNCQDSIYAFVSSGSSGQCNIRGFNISLTSPSSFAFYMSAGTILCATQGYINIAANNSFAFYAPTGHTAKLNNISTICSGTGCYGWAGYDGSTLYLGENVDLSSVGIYSYWLQSEAAKLIISNRVITPEMFGAIGDDSNDDTTAIQLAINTASGLVGVSSSTVDGAVVLFRDAIYKTTQPLNVRPNVTLRGSGRAASLIHYTGTNTVAGALKLVVSGSDICSHVVIEELGVLSDEGFCIYADPSASDYDEVFTYNGATYTHVTSICHESYQSSFKAVDYPNDIMYCGTTIAPVPGGFGCFRAVTSHRVKSLALKFEYWNGGSWQTISTTNLNNGNRHLYYYWTNPLNWATSTLDSVTKYWLRVSADVSQTEELDLFACYRLSGNLINNTFRNLRLSAGKEAIYLDRGYSQSSEYKDIVFYNGGGGCVSIVGNANILDHLDQEFGSTRSVGGGDNSDYRAPLAGFIVAGTSNVVRSCLFENLLGPAVGYYCSGADLVFDQDWYEITNGGLLGVTHIFEEIHGGQIGQLAGGTACLTGQIDGPSFWDCQCTIDSLVSSSQTAYTSDIIKLDIDDIKSFLTIGQTAGNYMPGTFDDSRILIGTGISTVAWGAIGHGVTMPLTGNMLVNGNFEMGTYGWTITPENGATLTTTVENSTTGGGKRLKIVISGGVAGDKAATITQNITLPTGLANGYGYLSFRTARTTDARVFGLINMSDAGGREQDTYLSLRVYTGAGSPSILGFWCYADGTGNGTCYIEDAQFAIGNYGNRVPVTAAQRQWVDGSVEIKGTTFPATGDWQVGDKVINQIPSVGNPTGWVCVGAGSPGDWTVDGYVGIEPEVIGDHGVYYPEDFGAIGNGIADDTAALQATIDAAIALGGGEIILRSGATYLITDTLFAYRTYGGAYQYCSFSMKGTHRAVQSATMMTPIILGTFLDKPLLIMQAVVNCTIFGVEFRGPNSLWPNFASVDDLLDDTNFYVPGLAIGDHNPQCGICIDPFHVAITGADQYPGMAAKYLPGMFSSSITIDGCELDRHAVGIGVGLHGQQANCENFTFRDTVFNECRISIRTLNGQSRNMCVTGCSFALSRECVSNMTESCASPWGAPPTILGGSAGFVKHLFSIQASTQSFSVTGFYAEGFLSIGYFGPGFTTGYEAICFTGCTFYPIYCSERQIDSVIYAFAPVSFFGCGFGTNGYPLAIANYANGWGAGRIAFHNCSFDSSMQNRLLITANDPNSVLLDSCRQRTATVPAWGTAWAEGAMGVTRTPVAWNVTLAEAVPGTVTFTSDAAGPPVMTIGDVVCVAPGSPTGFVPKAGHGIAYYSNSYIGIITNVVGSAVTMQYVPESVFVGDGCHYSLETVVPLLHGPVTTYGIEAPTSGIWSVGDVCINSAPAIGDPVSWTCITAGTPGSWQECGSVGGSSLFITPEMFGAVGDGITNDGPAIQLAIDAAKAAGGGIVQFSAKVYLILQNVGALSASGIVLRGMGYGATTIMDGRADEPASPTPGGLPTGSYYGLLSFVNCTECGIEDLEIVGAVTSFDALNTSSGGRKATFFRYSARCWVIRVLARATRDEAIYADSDCPGWLVDGCTVLETNSNGINLNSTIGQSAGARIVNNYCYKAWFSQIQAGGDGITVQGNICTATTSVTQGAWTIVIDNHSHAVVSDNIIYDCDMHLSGSSAIILFGTANPDAVCIISNNIIRGIDGWWFPYYGGPAGGAIEIRAHAGTVAITDNTISGCCWTNDNQNHAIIVRDLASTGVVSIEGNTIRNTPGQYLRVGIEVLDSIVGSKVIVGDNTFENIDTRYRQDGYVDMTFSGSPPSGENVFFPEYYGAMGDGTTDDTLAIQTAIDAAAAISGVVELQSKQYLITSPLNTHTGRIIIRGKGWSVNHHALYASAGTAYDTWMSNTNDAYINGLTGSVILAGSCSGFTKTDTPAPNHGYMKFQDFALVSKSGSGDLSAFAWGTHTNATLSNNYENVGLFRWAVAFDLSCQYEGIYTRCVANGCLQGVRSGSLDGTAVPGNNARFYSLDVQGCDTGIALYEGQVFAFNGVFAQDHTKLLYISPNSNNVVNDISVKDVYLESNQINNGLFWFDGSRAHDVGSVSAGSSITIDTVHVNGSNIELFKFTDSSPPGWASLYALSLKHIRYASASVSIPGYVTPVSVEFCQFNTLSALSDARSIVECEVQSGGTAVAYGLQVINESFPIAGTWLWPETVTPTIYQSARATDAVTHTMSFIGQTPYAGSTGVNRNSGGFDFTIPAPAAGGSFGSFTVKQDAVSRFTIYPNGSIDLNASATIGIICTSVYAFYLTNTYIQTYCPTFEFQSGVVSPTVQQQLSSTNSATGNTLTIQAQRCTGTTSTGGSLALLAGDGTSANGHIEMGVYGSTFAPGGLVRVSSAGQINFLDGASARRLIEWTASPYVFIGDPAINGVAVYSGAIITLTPAAQTWTFTNAAMTLSSGMTSPSIYQVTDAGAAVTGQTLLIHSQDCSGTGATVGGDLLLRPGHGVTHGKLALQDAGGIDRIIVEANNDVNIETNSLFNVYTGGALRAQMGNTFLYMSFASLYFASSIASPSIYQEDLATVGGSGTDLTVYAQGVSAVSGTAYSGDLGLRGGIASGSGTNKHGNIWFHAAPAVWQSMEKGMFIGNSVTAPTGNPTSGWFIYVDPVSGDLIALSANGNSTTLALK